MVPFERRKRFKSSNIECWATRERFFRTSASSLKNAIYLIYFKQSRRVEKCKRGPLGFSNIRFVAKNQKIERGPFGDIEKFSKSHSA